jgi:hypothetical protein
VTFDPSSRARLGPRSIERFSTGTLFDEVGRAVAGANCLPRKELFESWEVARRARRRFRGGRVVDLAAGHGLLAWLMILLDDSSECAIAVDTRIPKSAPAIATAMTARWPRLEGRVQFIQGPLADVELFHEDVVVSSHACGDLTDVILQRAADARARVVVLPCCQDANTGDRGGLGGWLDPALAIDVTRAAKLRARGYEVATQTIPQAITPKNRLLLGSFATP